ncbi:hypothetical protein FRB96_000022 [Tulasnella sp. 330]|nr:hypothetical protein FRB96_000022 [Tulasnella sp. 330]KAG8882633.1 hypothetical protein FRB97_007979 [Tulasnella sp. 331]
MLPSKEPAGTVRIVPSKTKIGRLCLLPDYRKHRFGSDLMSKAHGFLQSYLAEHHLKEGKISLHAQIPVIPFYARWVNSVFWDGFRLGYTAIGEIFDEDGAPHQKMILTLQPATVA